MLFSPVDAARLQVLQKQPVHENSCPGLELTDNVD